MKSFIIQYQQTDNRFLMFLIGLLFIIFSCFYAYLGTLSKYPINHSTTIEKASDGLLLSPWTRDTIPWKGW